MSTSIIETAKRMSLEHNVSLKVIDPISGEVTQTWNGHNTITHSMLLGIGHYLAGDGILNQGYDMLSNWIPRYISLGTMGLLSQEQDEDGLPAGIGVVCHGDEADKFGDYMAGVPGFGADGYDPKRNNFRKCFGLGPMFDPHKKFDDPQDPRFGKFVGPVGCELISPSCPRAMISFRDVVPEDEAEIPQTIDVVFSAMVSTGALAQFRDYDKDYVFITEVGLWSTQWYTDGGDNGLLAGFRIIPPDQEHWDMRSEYNRHILKTNILKVKRNQVVQVIWKVQLGGIDDIGGIEKLYPDKYKMKWWDWDGENLTST